jgi:large conductance mechanosensitive channel
VGFAVFIVIKNMNKLKRDTPAPVVEATTKECPFCYSVVSIKATKCPNCTSSLQSE